MSYGRCLDNCWYHFSLNIYDECNQSSFLRITVGYSDDGFITDGQFKAASWNFDWYSQTTLCVEITQFNEKVNKKIRFRYDNDIVMLI